MDHFEGHTVANTAYVDASRVAEKLDNYDVTVQQAAIAHQEEKDQSLWDAIKENKKAVAWSMALSASLIMEGYDLVIINSFYGQDQFQHRYGQPKGDGTYFISAPWQTGLSNSALCGQIIGLAFNGWLSQKFGYRKTMMGAMAFMAAAIFPVFFAPSLPILSFGEVMCGLPWGIFQTLSTAYAADICPMVLRPLLTTYVNMCWGFGILYSSGVARAAISLTGEKAYKLPFALQWIWPVPLFLVAFFCPESPWWLIRQGRREDAKHSLRRLTQASVYTDEQAERQLALLEHTNAVERATVEGASYLDCFRGSNLRRTEIACAVWAIQWWCGNPLIGFAVTFLQQAGLNEEKSFDFNLGMNTMYFVGTVISWGLMTRFGRRSLYIFGNALMAAVCLGIAIAGFTSASLPVGILMIILNLAYNVSVGPVCYCIVAEIGSTRLRPMTVVLARISYNLTGLITNTLTPRMIQPTAWGWGARSGLFWMGTALISMTYCIFRLPETKGRSFGELDILFEKKVSAFRFAKTNVELFDAHHTSSQSAQREESIEKKESTGY